MRVTQILRPVADIGSSDGWVTQAGVSTNLYTAIDDVTTDATDYIATEGLPPVSDNAQFPIPLIDAGGLYGNGQNDPPTAHMNAGLSVAVTLPATGTVLQSQGMSTTAHIWNTWVPLANSVANMAAPGMASASQVAEDWAYSDTPWDKATSNLAQSGLTLASVQVIWNMVVSGTAAQVRSPTVQMYEDILIQSRIRCPNLKMMFFNTYPYGGYKPAEPDMWNSGIVLRQFILNHLGQTAPWVGWGPYLWANNGTARSDGLTWETEDYINNGSDIHLSDPIGRTKAAELQEGYFRFSPLTPWYR